MLVMSGMFRGYALAMATLGFYIIETVNTMVQLR
jgi:hypothetical protein